MQPRFQFTDEAAEITLALIGYLLEIQHDAGLPRVDNVRHQLLHQALARRGMVQHRGHFRDVPDGAVGIVEQRHGGDFEAERLHPAVELGIGFQIELPVGGDGMELLGNQQVNIAIMQLQRGQAVGVPAHVECDAQRIVLGRHLAQSRHAAYASAAPGRLLRFRTGQDRMQTGAAGRQEQSGKIHALCNGDKKRDQHNGK